MPSVPVYIRKSNWAKWQALDSPADWINEALEKLPDGSASVLDKVKADPARFCPNGHSIPVGRTKCMGKGCKYS